LANDFGLLERRKQLHITEPWLAAERCLVTKGPPPANWTGVRVAFGLGPESQLLAAALRLWFSNKAERSVA